MRGAVPSTARDNHTTCRNTSQRGSCLGFVIKPFVVRETERQDLKTTQIPACSGGSILQTEGAWGKGRFGQVS